MHFLSHGSVLVVVGNEVWIDKSWGPKLDDVPGVMVVHCEWDKLAMTVCVFIVAAWWVVWALWVHEREVRLHGELCGWCEWVVMRYGCMVSCVGFVNGRGCMVEVKLCGWACGCRVVCGGHGWVEDGVWLHSGEVRVSMWLGTASWWGVRETLSYIWAVWELWDGCEGVQLHGWGVRETLSCIWAVWEL